MPGPAVQPVAGEARPPRRAEVVVIGGGIVGVCAALELAERGVSVALVEKGRVGAEQSSRNWGWVRLGRRDPIEIPLMIEALRLWRGLDRRVGADLGHVRSGILFPSPSEARQSEHGEWLAHLEGRQTRRRLLSERQAKALLPGWTGPLHGALWMPEDGRAEPQRAAPAVAAAAGRKGASILQDCAARAIRLAAGRVSGVVTERGEIACDAVLLAGGAWSRLFLGNAGVALPQLTVVNTVLRTEPLRDAPDFAVGASDFAVRKRADGGVTVSGGRSSRFELTPDALRLARLYVPALREEWGTLRFRLSRRFVEEAMRKRRWSPEEATPFEAARTLDPAPDQAEGERALAALRRTAPAYAGARIAQIWAGAIDVTPDALPVISRIEERPGLFVATGFSGHGFGIGPGAGRLAADLVMGRSPLVDPTPFRLSRFSDGSPIRRPFGF